MERDADKGEEPQDGDGCPAFKLEQNTIAEPAELDIWVDGRTLGLEGDVKWLVGMALGARWAQVGPDEEASWWIPHLMDRQFHFMVAADARRSPQYLAHP